MDKVGWTEISVHDVIGWEVGGIEKLITEEGSTVYTRKVRITYGEGNSQLTLTMFCDERTDLGGSYESLSCGVQ